VWPNVAWRLFWRELKRGELWVIAFALCLAVFTVVSLSGITESVRSALAQRSANFIAADKSYVPACRLTMLFSRKLRRLN